MHNLFDKAHPHRERIYLFTLLESRKPTNILLPDNFIFWIVFEYRTYIFIYDYVVARVPSPIVGQTKPLHGTNKRVCIMVRTRIWNRTGSRRHTTKQMNCISKIRQQSSWISIWFQKRWEWTLPNSATTTKI